jgi:hypothetical protein
VSSIDAMRDWWGETGDPLQIVVLCGEGVLTVSIMVPWFLKPDIIGVLDERLHELFIPSIRWTGEASPMCPS